MHEVYLLTGSNLGDRLNYLETAVQNIKNCGKILKLSAIYKTQPWGLEDQPVFYNQAILLQTDLSPADMMIKLLSIENEMGRERSIKMGPRTIDIDILLYGNLVLNTELITVPHPYLHERRFALTPLDEIAEKVIHPVLNKTIHQLLDECSDHQHVEKISIEEI